MGSCLHDFYQGVEELLEIIATDLDESQIEGAQWHKDLLFRMAGERPLARPAVISVELLEQLQPFLRFRPVYLNIPGRELYPALMGPLLEKISAVYADFRQAILTLTDWLKQEALRPELAGTTSIVRHRSMNSPAA